MPCDPHTRPTRRRRLVASAVVAALLLGACSAGDSGGDPARGVADEAGVAASATPGEADTQAAEAPAAAPVGVDLAAVTAGRQIVSTAEVDLTAPEAGEVADRIAELATEAGGFVSGEETSKVQGTRTTLIVRVPPEEFDGLLDAIGGLGELTAQRIETDDVTQQVVDLESRITTAEASVVRLRELLDRSGSVADIAQVETELLERETTLETLRGQLRTVERQVDLATITVNVASEDPDPVVADGEDLPSFLGGLESGWDALVLALAGLAAIVGLLLPWAILLAVVSLPLWWVVRSRRRSGPSAPTPA